MSLQALQAIDRVKLLGRIIKNKRLPNTPQGADAATRAVSGLSLLEESIIVSVSETTITIAIIDEHVLFREGLRLILKDMPRVEIAGEAADDVQGLELISNCKPDIVLLDIALLDGNGIQFLHSVRAQSPETKVLILGNSRNEDILISAIESGAKGYLSKEADTSTLYQAILSVDKGEIWAKRYFFTKYFESLSAEDSEHRSQEENLINSLTPRQKEVLLLLAKGSTNREIADGLCISEKTVKCHLNNIFKKLSIHNRLEAIMYTFKLGIN